MATLSQTAHSPLLLGPGDHGRAVSDEEFVGAEFEEPWRYELVDGRIVVMWPDSEAYDDASEPWRDCLGAYKLAHRDRVDKVVSEAWVRIGRGKYRIADITVYLSGSRSQQRRPDRVPEIVVEVLSPGAETCERDAVEKRSEYHGLGVLEYVLVGYERKQVSVLTHSAQGYRETVLASADTYQTPHLPGLLIPLNEILPRS
ncbi:MAG: Uma2 family endonuclease [Isosphaeraceae bacterium]|nr:Uma2 family endonuclease [Isosphaeraceae bacterium]